MRKHAMLAAVVLAAFGMAACGEEDPTDTGSDDDEIVGVWFSGGEDVAPGLQLLFGTDSIFATFNEDGSYTVLEHRTTDGVQGTLDYDGSYQVGTEADGQIRSITLNQSAPYTAIAEGIFQVSASGMTYEVVQTQPSAGATPPTVEGGFGSTVANDQETDLFVQQYVRRN
jgi:hypothetical protein